MKTETVFDLRYNIAALYIAILKEGIATPEQAFAVISNTSVIKATKDEDVKEVILKNIDHLTLFLNEVVFYLDKFWAKDELVNTEIKNLAKKDKVLYHYNISLIFEKFSNLEFDETFFEESLLQSGKFWIVKYRMILWLKRVKKYELILEVDDIEYNYFIEREKLEVSLNNKKDPIAKKASIKKALQSNNPLIALKALQMTNFFSLSKSDMNFINGFFLFAITSPPEILTINLVFHREALCKLPS